MKFYAEPLLEVTLSNLVEWLQRQFWNLSNVLNEQHTLEVFYVEPTRPQTGQLVYADGTKWNPGSGAGVYVYTGSAWSKL